ncbi:hypothetical protein [Enterovirga rhinocerotis]|uniref:hypothetical protein n=1 Tax=Enterovirga rhinocerotis TaxID=1339210 RepID=UPI00105F6A55|nr:hypothetical protein [Enterovirga rhinocerotis]
MNGAEIVMEAVRFAGAEDEAYIRGVDDALTIFHYTLGNLKDERSNALVVRAAEAAGGFGDRSRVGAMLFQTTFMRRIEDRLFD